MKTFTKLPFDETIVQMTEHKGQLVVASNKHIYILNKDRNLQRVVFETKGDSDE